MSVGPVKRFNAVNRTDGKCGYCGADLDERNLTIDHKIPKCHGGDHAQENLLACCRWCNTSKGRSHIEDFRLRMSARALPVKFNAEQLAYLASIGVAPAVGFDPNHQFYFERMAINEPSI